MSGQPYNDNDLVIAKADGAPARADRVTNNFAQFLRHQNMPHIRFHDLRHPYVKHTTKNKSLQKQKSQAIKT